MTEPELKQLRNVRIHTILSIKDEGRKIAIQCPQHRDKHPSFFVFPDNSFYCFSCNASGQGAIDFCKFLGYNFLETIEELKKYA
jgi:DNA primase